MSPLPIPYAVRALALSHDQARRTAVWTAAVTASAAGFVLTLPQWALLGVTTAVCGAAVRMVCSQLVAAWLVADPARLACAELPDAPDATSYDGATRAALARLAGSLP